VHLCWIARDYRDVDCAALLGIDAASCVQNMQAWHMSGNQGLRTLPQPRTNAAQGMGGCEVHHSHVRYLWIFNSSHAGRQLEPISRVTDSWWASSQIGTSASALIGGQWTAELAR